jgi:hypothetical protein
LDFVHEGLEGAVLVGGSGGPVFLKLDDWLKTEGSSGDLRFENPDEVSSGGFCEVGNDWL